MTTAATLIGANIELPWHNRWEKPDLKQLIDPLPEQQNKAVGKLMDRIAEYPNLEQSIVWYGPAWHWTIQYDLLDDKGKHVQTMCYIIPNHESPLFSLPLTDAHLETMPLRRLTKFIRSGIKVSKKAVEVHWATWRVSSSTEVELLMDLFRRKYKIYAEPPRSKRTKKSKSKSKPKSE